MLSAGISVRSETVREMRSTCLLATFLEKIILIDIMR